MAVIAAPDAANGVCEILAAHGERVLTIGAVTAAAAAERVELVGLEAAAWPRGGGASPS